MAFQLHTFPDDDTLARQAASRWLGELRTQTKNIPKGRAYCVALSGRAHCAKLFFRNREAGARRNAGFSMRSIFSGRTNVVCHPADPESNYALAKELLFEPLKIPDAQVHRLRGEENEALALRDALENIATWGSPEKGGGEPIFDMIFLGMGEDGHVASLFPGESEAAMADPAFYRAVTAVKPPPRRFTLGYGAVIHALQVWVLVAGAGKQGALKESLSPSGKTPLARGIEAASRDGNFFRCPNLRRKNLLTVKKIFVNVFPESPSNFYRCRCSFRVGREVMLVAGLEQRQNSWPRYPSERPGEGVLTLSSLSQSNLALLLY